MISHRIRLGILLSVMLSSLRAGCTSTSRTNNVWTIFPEHRAEEMGIGTWLFPEADVEGYWTPTQEDILNLEGKLDAFLRQNAESFRRQPPVWEQLDNYKRQYVGLTIKGKPIVYGNFLCTETSVNWKKEWVFVLDRGDCFFQLQFDVETETFMELTVNGEA